VKSSLPVHPSKLCAWNSEDLSYSSQRVMGKIDPVIAKFTLLAMAVNLMKNLYFGNRRFEVPLRRNKNGVKKVSLHSIERLCA